MVEKCGHAAAKVSIDVMNGVGVYTDLHWASQPCSVTAPVSSESVVSGNFCVAHGFPGDVLNSSSNSGVLRAPSWSCGNEYIRPSQFAIVADAYFIEGLEYICEELVP